MKNSAFRILFIVLAAVLVLPVLQLQQPAGLASAAAEDSSVLAPQSAHRIVTKRIAHFARQYHYRPPQLNTAFSQRVFDQYLLALDPNHMYFLAADVDAMDRYRNQFATAAAAAEIEPAFEIFAHYAERVEERIQHALSLLDEDFDFTIDEDYRFDRTEEPWAETREELEEVWRKRVKNDWLALRLTDQEDEEIKKKLTQRYENMRRRIEELNSEDVFSLFMNAFTQSIEPHSTYMSPRTSENFEISMRLSLDGIGAMLQRETEHTTIVEIVPGGPADLDGRLKSGDRIIGIGQGEEGELVDVIGWRLDDVVSLIRGERGTIVRLEILPAETGMGGASEIIRIERNEVKLEEQAASSEIIELPTEDGGLQRIGIIKVPVFYIDFDGRSHNRPDYRSSTRDVRRLIHELDQEHVDGLIMDLRGNGGGALVEATTMTGLFIDTGPVVQVRDSRGKVELRSDNEPGMAWEGPLAVLVNRNSASASEIFAAAIQDYGRGVIIGEPTFGKGTVQNLIGLNSLVYGQSEPLGQLKLTMAQFYRIAGGSTQNRGVLPDIRLPTAGDPDEYGESSLDFAMPWAEIDPVSFEPVASLRGLIERARARHELRLETDQELVDLMEDLAEWEAEEDHSVISLLETTRRERMERAEARRARSYGSHDELAMAGEIEASTSSGASPEPDTVGATEEPSAADASEMAVQEEEEEEAGAEAESESEEKSDRDIYLRESARILVDLIELDRERLLAHRQID